jgi:fatty-acyl-CoA synthase
MANLAPALALAAPVALRPRFSASGFLPDVRRYGATYFNYVGRALAYILATPESPADSDNRLRLGFGTEASARDIERFSRRFGCRIVENYGSSEGVITIHRDQSTPEAALGRPPDTPAMDVIIADPATGKECPPARFDEHGGILNAGEAIGEIVNRAGAPAFEGYYRNEAAVQARLRDGWYWSGDLGYRDADGWFYFAGRGTDWLRVDSENFAAAPIERIVARFPGAVMVGVYPVPDPRTGDQVMAALELDPAAAFDPSSFADFLAAQPDLGTKWAPRFVRVVAAMPLTGTGKIDKQPLRSAGWETDDPVYWQPGRGEPYRRLTGDDRAELRREFSAHGRINLLDRR